MDNQRIAQVFQEIGDILEIQGANRFRVLAYHRAAQRIADMSKDLKDIYHDDPKELQEIPGIGKDLAAKIAELVTTGKCKEHQKILKGFDKGLLDMLRVRGIGPKKVKLFYTELKINSIAKLKAAAIKGMLRDLPKMGEKSEHEILVALDEFARHSERMMVSEALHQAELIIEYMKKCNAVGKIEYAGSLRRMKETVGDLDILVASKKPEKVMDHFVKYPHVVNVVAKGPTKTSVVLDIGVDVDLRVIDAKIFGAALQYFTGSKEHNVVIRGMAKKKGLKINEYGVFRGEKLVAGKTEEEVYKTVGMPYIIPELRENRGELQAAAKKKLPKVVELKDLRGDLHVHSKWSDGSDEIEDIARMYSDAGFEYIALTDHSPAVRVAHGLTPARYKKQWAEIDKVNAQLAKEAKKGKRPFKILKGTECDIMPDGSMDLPDKVLKNFDIVVAAVHSRFRMSEHEMTERILKAFKNPYVKIFGHPSGRLINQREPYNINMGKIIKAAAHHGVALEIDGQPARLDLFDFYCKMAIENGAKFTIDSDSHSNNQIKYLEFGISVAKRGWIEKKDVLNTRSLTQLLKYWEKRK